MHNIKIPHKNKLISLLHINACSLDKNFDELQHLLSCIKKHFDIIAIKKKLKKKKIEKKELQNKYFYYII